MGLDRLPVQIMSPRDHATIRSFVESKDLRLFHFTSLQNLAQIAKWGLIPRGTPEFERLKGIQLSDEDRLGHGANCISVGHTNNKMMYRKTLQSNAHFAVIEIDASVLWKKSWYATPTNSSNKEIREALKKYPGQFVGYSALQGLFTDLAETTLGATASRADLGILAGQSTDPQAELLIDSVIEPFWFNAVYCEGDQVLEIVKLRFPEIIEHLDLQVDHKFYTNRNTIDGSFWKGGQRLKYPLEGGANG